MIPLFDAEAVEFDVVPITLRLLKDPFAAGGTASAPRPPLLTSSAAVRLACAAQVGAIVKRLQVVLLLTPALVTSHLHIVVLAPPC